MKEMKNRLQNEMKGEEKVEAFEMQLQTLHQEYQQNAVGIKRKQQQVEQDYAEVECQGEALTRESDIERTILDRKRDEM